MNFSTDHQEANIVIDYSIIVVSSIGICASSTILSFIGFHLIKTKNAPHRLALLLTANMYIGLLLASILFLEQYIRVLPGHLYPTTVLGDGPICQARAYLLVVSLGIIFYSNTIQGFYRLCRVVFYTKPSLQSSRLYGILVIAQWILCCLLALPSLLLGDYSYSPDNKLCAMDFTNIRSASLVGITIYFFPMCGTIGCYIFTVKKVRRSGNNNLLQRMTHVQQIAARRDVVVLYRICILLVLFTAPTLPSLIAYFYTIFGGYRVWWSVPVQWLTFSLAVTTVSITLTVISPHVYNLWRKPLRPGIRVAPAIVVRN